MYLFRSLSKKRATAQGFQSKTAPQKPQLQAFILEPILTPSGVVDSPDTPDLVVMDFDQLDTSGIDIDFDVDDTDLSALSVPELEIPMKTLNPLTLSTTLILRTWVVRVFLMSRFPMKLLNLLASSTTLLSKI
jgi:hypothetical protein